MAGRRLPVAFDESVWRPALRGFSGPAKQTAESARAHLERNGIGLGSVLPCEAQGPDRTELKGCVKLYLPIADAPPSERPFAFVLQFARNEHDDLIWVFIAFGHRHPGLGVRSVYERAHRQLHGRFPSGR